GPGTADITAGPAMPRAAAERALAAGIALLEDERAADGVDIVACGEMGIGNSTAAAAMVAALTRRPARAVTGRGTGVDDARYERKVAAVEQALAANRPAPADGVGVLAALGGYEIGVLAGAYLAAGAARVPAVVDGLISSAAALVACALAPELRGYLVAGHRSTEPGHAAALDQLGLAPLLDLGLRLGEGSGAALGLTLCVAACRLLDEMATFDEAGVTASADAVQPEA
ncbi:MAG: nicotinate-nucleotide--dimethylbenzimidazole phosphoribosyltransferase, partial [Chloroflexi bacterium]|nr:nicotinate-nucleotide--dimethylbenzimidazole phosphoribosyltransferase [Chloroflexota bacterium]